MADERALRVLLVCAANQCRSRAAEALLQHALQDVPGIALDSAGVRALAPLPICDKAAAYVEQQGIATNHTRTAQQLTVEVLQQAHLVLAADASVRAAIVALDAEARARTFSLRGAGEAARHLTRHRRVAEARVAHASGQAHVIEHIDGEDEVLASALAPTLDDTARWLREELAVAHGYATVDGHDIADAHDNWRIRHSRTLEQVHTATTPLAKLLRELADGLEAG